MIYSMRERERERERERRDRRSESKNKIITQIRADFQTLSMLEVNETIIMQVKVNLFIP